MIQHVTVTGARGDQFSISAVAERYRSVHGKPLIVNCQICYHNGVNELLENNPSIIISNEVGEITLDAPTEHAVSNQVFYARQLGLEMEHASPVVCLRDEEIEAAKQTVSSPYVVMTSRAGWPSRDWELDKFAEVVDYLHSRGIKVVEVGKDVINCFGQIPTEHIPNTDLDLVNKSTLRQDAALLKNALFYFGVNSFVLQIAEAVGIPQITTVCDNGSMKTLFKRTIGVHPRQPCSPQCREVCASYECSLKSVMANQAIETISNFLREAAPDTLSA